VFTIYGPGVTDPIALEKLFVRPAVTKMAAVTAEQAIRAGESHDRSPGSASRAAVGQQKYQVAERATRQGHVLEAAQIMTAPVTSVLCTASVSEALALLESVEFRHFPVLSPANELVGMISDRDILRCMCGSGSACVHCAGDKQTVAVETIMQANVLSAHVQADARHIARLFVERRIGAMPITDNHQLVGMITRSDILRAVMVNFDLSLWL